MKAVMAKMKQSKDTLLKSHNAVLSMLSKENGDGVIKREHDGISELRVAFDAQTLIIDEIINDLIDEMKLKHHRKMSLFREYGEGMIKIATHYGLNGEIRVKSENDGGSINTNTQTVMEDVPSDPVPLDDTLTQSEDEWTESEDDAASTSHRDLYVTIFHFCS